MPFEMAEKQAFPSMACAATRGPFSSIPYAKKLECSSVQ